MVANTYVVYVMYVHGNVEHLNFRILMIYTALVGVVCVISES